MTPCRTLGSARTYLGNFSQSSYLTGASNAPIWDASGAIDPASPHLYTFNGIPSYINGTDLAGQNDYPAGRGHQRLQDAATPRWLL